MSIEPGTSLGAYQIVGLLGAGGMGAVYRARDARLGREVAIKVLPEEVSRSPERLARFEKEARALAALSHPHVLAVFDVGEVDGRPYLVTELLEGESLRERLSRERIPLETTIAWSIQLARGLSSAHQKGIVHRDLKPENLFIMNEGTVKILDFGLAKLSDRSDPERLTSESPTNLRGTSPGVLLGTVGYMSPEQVRGRKADARSDVFALGAVLYEMLTATRAFRGDSAVEVLSAILERPPPGLPPDVPRAVARIVMRCLEKRPEGRFPSAQDLVTALEALSKKTLPAEKERPSIAVLPFVNMSPDPDDEYFSDGITEEITNALTQVEDLRVAARTSAFKFKGKSDDLREVGDKLGVARVLEGSVRRAGKRLRITAQLVNVEDGYHLWSERFDRELDDVFAIQDEIATAIAERMRGKDSPTRQSVRVKQPTRNLEAYDLYLKGRFHWEQRGEGLRKGLEYFEKALSLDPDFALAHVGVADACCLLTMYSLVRAREAMHQAKAAAQRALEIDPTLAGAENALGFVAAFYEWDWQGAEEHFGRALTLDPFYAPAYYWKAVYLACRGRFEEALEHIERALELDPLGVPPNFLRGFVLMAAGRLHEANQTLREFAHKEPNSFVSHRMLGLSFLLLSQPEDAIRELEIATTLSNRHPWPVGDLAQAYAATGRTEEAEALFQELLDRARREYVAPVQLSWAAAALGRKDEALRFLEEACAERDSQLLFIGVLRSPGDFSEDPRFREILRRVGIAP